MADLTVESGDLDQRKVLNRLRRASGQLNALIRAVEAGKPCKEVVTQLSAVSAALDRAGYQIVLNAMKECLSNPESKETAVALGTATGVDIGEKVSPGRITPAELEKLFLSLA